MKTHGMKLLSAVALIALLLMTCSACQPAGTVPSQNDPASSANGNDPSNSDHKPLVSGGVAIILNMNSTDIHARLHDNAAANAFLELLPYTVTVSRAADDLCGSVSEQLPHDPAEDQDTWSIGEIGWFDGWFTILCDNEEGMPKRTRTIIGKIDEEDIPVMQALTGRVEIKITLDESHSDQAAGETGTPTVYFTSDISPEGLLAVYDALDWEPTGEVAVKLSTGEPPASNYLRPELIKDLVQSVNGTIVECNTAYGGSRASTAMHYQVAKDHGFTDIADFQILDEDGFMTLPVSGGSVLTENYVGAAFTDYDSYLILSHFKGHSMAGFGGAIKNISIGLGSSEGKAWIHSGGTSRTNAWGGKQDAFLEAMAEAGKSVADYLGNGEGTIGVPLYACGGGTIPLLQAWLYDGLSMGSAAAFMLTGPSTKITNLGALKIALGIKRFLLYLLFVMLFSFVSGIIVNAIV